jgi:hypothetical protein
MPRPADGQARDYAEIKDAAPDASAPTTGMTPTVPKPAVVPVRTPDD